MNEPPVAAPRKEYAVLYAADKGFYFKDLPRPARPTAGRVVVRPMFVGICGSDLHALLRYTGAGLSLGHEWVGRVESVGPSVDGITRGDLVTSTAFIGCGACEHCARSYTNWCPRASILGSEELGALRTWIDLPAHALVHVPIQAGPVAVLFEIAAVADAAVALGLADGGDRRHSVLVFGCGTVGILVGLGCQGLGHAVLMTDIEQARVGRARSCGLDAVPLQEVSNGVADSLDAVFDAAGDYASPGGPWNHLARVGRKGFNLVVIGKYSGAVQLMPDEFSRRATRVSFVRGSPHDALQRAVNNWAGTLLKYEGEIITHRFPAWDVDKALSAAEDRSLSGKVILDLTQEPRSF